MTSAARAQTARVSLGSTLPVYVAMPIGHHELYVAWLDPSSNDALVDVFVMNFKTHVVFDYARKHLPRKSPAASPLCTAGPQPLP